MKTLIYITLVAAWLTALFHDVAGNLLFAAIEFIFVPLGMLRGIFIWFGWV